MKKFVTLLLFVTTVAVLVAAGQEKTKSGRADGQAAIAKIRSDWIDAYNNSQPDKIADMYAENAIFLPAIGKPVEGQGAILDHWKKERR